MSGAGAGRHPALPRCGGGEEESINGEKKDSFIACLTRSLHATSLHYTHYYHFHNGRPRPPDRAPDDACGGATCRASERARAQD